MLMQDPLALMTHFILLLPLNVDLPIFTTVARSCFNLQLAQTLVRLAFTLSYNERSLLLGEFNANGHLKTFGALMGQVIEKLEPTGIFSEEDYVIEMDEDSSSVMLDMNSLENEAARLLIPFLRTASLVKHYIYKLNLPEINEDDEEFDQLVKFLDLIAVDHHPDVSDLEEPMDQAISGRVNLIDVIQWFSANGEELQMWCAEFADLACRDHLGLARQAMRVNVLWKQPQLLRLHQDYDQIFQVIWFLFSPAPQSPQCILNYFVVFSSSTIRGLVHYAIRYPKNLRFV